MIFFKKTKEIKYKIYFFLKKKNFLNKKNFLKFLSEFSKNSF